MILTNALVKFLHRLRILPYVNINTEANYGDTRFIIPLVKGIGYSHCLKHEDWLWKLLRMVTPYLEDGRYFVDVGVNVGQSLTMVKSLYPHVPYVGFEPNEVCVDYVNLLMARNKIVESVVYPFGLSDAKGFGQLNFYYSGADDSSASVLDEFRKDKVHRRQQVALRVGDDLDIWLRANAGIVKIDVEGAELEVIKGLKTVISKDKPCIICEVLPAYSKDNRFRVERQAELRDLLQQLHYEIYQVSSVGLVKVDNFVADTDIEDCNYMFVPCQNNIFGSKDVVALK